jgi:enoyl-CoA hydratase
MRPSSLLTMTLRVVWLFSKAHGHFCAGWDLQAGARLHAVDGKALTHRLGADADARAIGPMGPSRLVLSKPVIAAVSGAAVAGGMELALWCTCGSWRPMPISGSTAGASVCR